MLAIFLLVSLACGKSATPASPETPLDKIRSLPYTPDVIWEVEYLIGHGYEFVRGGGPNGMDILLPTK